MYKKIFFFLFSLVFIVNAKAQNNPNDSLQYLSHNDTIFLEIVGEQYHKFFKHIVKKGHTAFSISRFYGLPIEDLYSYNPTIANAPLKIGQLLLIPLPNGAIRRYKDANFVRKEYAPIIYKVKKGDTLYGIAKRVFRMDVEDMMKNNNMDSFVIQIDKPLTVGWLSINGIKDSLQMKLKLTPKSPATNTIEDHYKQQFVKSGKSEFFEQGTAFWNKNDALLKKHTGLYAMHRTAPKGSYIKVKNPMNGRELYLKVLGNFPYTSRYKKNVLVVIPPYVAQLFGARDESFFVKTWSIK